MTAMQPRKDFLKVVVLGNSRSGKTTLVTKYVTGEFLTRPRPTIGADFLSKDIEIDSTGVRLQVWDTEGEQRFQCLAPPLAIRADGCVLVYDCGNAQGLGGLERRQREYFEVANPPHPGLFPMVLVGCKADSELQVTMGAAQTWARNQGDLPVFLTSAKENFNVSEVFAHIATTAFRTRKAIQASKETRSS